ncbi:histidine kinase [Shewanella sairae]|uniref:histidine kinase n=2 Tax=Shewanella sairae TaxID=190310 RepID=A0ABQ4PKC1_9GAMM|nr:histidine kinase [Shewanella sairae]
MVFGVNAWLAYQNEKQDIYAQLAQNADNAALHLQYLLTSAETDTRSTADLLTEASHQGMTPDEERLKLLLIRRLERHEDFYGNTIAFRENVIANKSIFAPYAYRQGHKILTLDIGSEGYNYANGEWDWWSQAINNDNGYWTPPYFDAGGGNELMVSYAHSFGDHMPYLGVVTVDLALSQIPKILNTAADNVVVINDMGQMIYHHDKNLLLGQAAEHWLTSTEGNQAFLELVDAGTQGYASIEDMNGGKYLASMAVVPALNWRVVILTSDQLLYVELLNAISSLGSTLSLLSILLLITGYLTAKRLTRPIEDLEKGIVAFGAGDTKRISKPVGATSEIVTLTNKFNDMAEVLEQREAALLDSSGNRFAKLIDGMSDKSFYCSVYPDGLLGQVSAGVEKVLGITPELLKRKYQRMFSGNPINELNWQYMDQALLGEKVPPHQVEMVDGQGKLRRLDVFMQPLLSDNQEVLSVEVLFSDVSEQFSAAAWSNAVLESAPEAILIVGERGQLVFSNSRCQKLFGYDEEQMKTLSVDELVPEADRGGHAEQRTQFIAEGRDRKMGLNMGSTSMGLKSDGTEFPVEISLGLLPKNEDGEQQVAATVRDITVELAIAQQIKDSENRFRGLVANIPGVVYRTSIGDLWMMEYVSDNISNISGYPASDFIENSTRSYKSIMVEEDVPLVNSIIEEALLEQKSFEVQYRIKHRDGSIHWVQEKGKAIYDDNATALWFDGSIHDITSSKLAQEVIVASQRQLETITESIPSTVYQMHWHDDSASQFTFLSSACITTLGFHRNEVLNNFDLVAECIVSEDRADIIQALSGKSSKGMKWTKEFRYQHPVGDTRWLQAGAHGDLQNDGSIIWNGYLMDITDRKQVDKELEEREAHFRALFDNAGIGIVNVDEKGTILDCNEQFSLYLQVGADEVIGRSFFDYQFDEDRGATRALFHELSENGNGCITTEVRLVNQASECMWMDLSLTRLQNSEGKLSSFVLSMANITSLKLVSQQLSQAKDIADAANKAKSDFLANMSHEIRTPMNAIIGMSQLCLQTDLDSKQQNYVQKIDRASKSLLGIINDILDFSKIEAGKLDIESVPFQLDTMLEDLSDMFSSKVADKQLELLFAVAPNIPRHLEGDPLRLSQVLINLMNNAIKFTEQGEVLLSISQLEQVGKQVVLKFSVRDSGIGLTEEQRNKLFKSFSQADTSTTRRYGGTGLGLAISKQLVELMGGEIGVESQFGNGSTFYFSVSLKVADEKQLKVEHDVEGKRILVVDDSETARDILRTTLENMGFEVDVAKSGLEAIEACKIQDYAVALIDWQMPEVEGLETAKQIIANQSQPPKILIVSAHASQDLTIKMTDSGIAGYIPKPISASRLLDGIMSSLGKKAAVSVRRNAVVLNQHLLSQLKGKRVLLVEDNDMNQEIACEFLEQAGMVVSIAENGQVALEKLTMQSFDIVLMDCQMPVMDGYQATREIRLQPNLVDLPVIAMTANAMAGDKEMCLSAGMNDHIAKPIEVSLLYSTLLSYLGAPKSTDTERYQLGASNEQQVLFWPQHPEIDIDKGLQLVQNSVRLYRRIFERFYQGKLNVADRIGSALMQGKIEDAILHAHTLKGVAGNLSSPKLVELARHIEEQLTNETDVDISEELEQLAKLVGSIGKAIADWQRLVEQQEQIADEIDASGKTDLTLNAITSEKPIVDTQDSFSDTQLITVIKELFVALEEGDADAVEKIRYVHQHVPAPLGLQVEMAINLVNSYQFDEAIDLLKSIFSDIK